MIDIPNNQFWCIRNDTSIGQALYLIEYNDELQPLFGAYQHLEPDIWESMEPGIVAHFIELAKADLQYGIEEARNLYNEHHIF